MHCPLEHFLRPVHKSLVPHLHCPAVQVSVAPEQCCLEPGNYNLECKDSYGDGWNGGYIEVNGEKYCESFSTGSEETSQIIIEGNGKYPLHFV